MTTAKLVKANSAKADSQTLRAEIAALRAKYAALHRAFCAAFKLLEQFGEQIEQMDARAAKIEQHLRVDSEGV